MSFANQVEEYSDKFLTALAKESFQLKLISNLKLIFALLIIASLAWLVFSFIQLNFQVSNRTGVIENNINRILSASAGQDNQSKLSFDVEKIANINLFGELRVTKAPVEKVEKPVEEKELEFTLVGTYKGLGEDIAIVLDSKTKEQDIFAPNQEIFDQALLLEVHSDHILINHLGQKKKIFIEDGGGAAPASSDSSSDSQVITVDKAKVDEALQNLPLLLTQARAVPYFKNGKSVGLRLFAIKKGSLFDEIELKNGDILQDINGNSLADITQAVKLFEELKSERAVTLNLERGKKPVTYEYKIK